MLQLFFAVAFSAVPLTLYVPPIRSLNLFVETLEELLRDSAAHTLRVYPRFRQAFSRLFASIFRVSNSRLNCDFCLEIIRDDGFSFRFLSFFSDSVSDLFRALEFSNSLFPLCSRVSK
ncbi:hypothetical protein SDJN02_11617, partial [Cucurbita argyrosperma subsp. argyrosperma]